MVVKGQKRVRGAIVAEAGDLEGEKGAICRGAGEHVKKKSKKHVVESVVMEETGRRIRLTRAAQATSWKEETVELDDSSCQIEVKKQRVVEQEAEAVLGTASSGEGSGQLPQRRLVDFMVHDEDGKAQPIERVDKCAVYISAVVLAMDGAVDRQAGLRCQGFGPLDSWSITGYEERKPVIWLSTGVGDYVCDRPSGDYKKHFDALYDKALVCVEVYRALSKPDGGNPDSGLDDLIANVSRSLAIRKQKTKRMAVPAQRFSREFILSLGSLIWEQLTGLDESASDAQQLFTGLPALVALKEASEVRLALANDVDYPMLPKSLTIGEAGSSTAVDSSPPALTEEEARLFQKYQKMVDAEEKKMLKQTKRAQAAAARGMSYIKISEVEIAADYPLPAFYKADEAEMDEYILFDDDVSELAPADLPRRMLHDWALYNSDSRLISLELLPMLAGTEADVEIFGSGLMTEDDGSGFDLGESVSGSGSQEGGGAAHGIRIYLSAVKEWMIEFGASMLFISIRTDGAWYRLGRPSEQYSPWYKPVLRTAELAIKIITMLQEELRIARLSFSDVIKRLAEKATDGTTFISSKAAEVERYVVVHGQIILQQFCEYPDARIRNCAFVSGLASKMEERRHTKLTVSKKKTFVMKGKNSNPRANMGPDVKKQKAMRATTTTLVNSIWSSFYNKIAPETDDAEKVKGEICLEDNEEMYEDDSETDADLSEIETEVRGKPLEAKKPANAKAGSPEFRWIGEPQHVESSKLRIYRKASFNGEDISAGAAVLADGKGNDTQVLLVEYLFENSKGLHMLHGRVLERGLETVLGNAADARELFLVDRCVDAEIEKTLGIITVEIQKRPWGHAHRKANYQLDMSEKTLAIEREQNGLPVQYFCRALYSPCEGAFFSLQRAKLGEGNGVCKACEQRNEDDMTRMQVRSSKDEFKWKGITYQIGDYVYLDPSSFQSSLPNTNNADRVKASGNKGLRAFSICQLLGFQNETKSSTLSVRRFYRPEDVGPEKTYKADIYEVYYSEELTKVDISRLRGRCEVRRPLEIHSTSAKSALSHVFFCGYIYDPKAGTVKQLPPSIKLSSSKAVKQKPEIAKGKGKMLEAPNDEDDPTSSDRLATLDIFAGCGGLSEGLQQSGVSRTKWAIEYDQLAAEAFKLNHPEAQVFCANCNVILRSIMEKGGDLDDCISPAEAADLSLSSEQLDHLPSPGQVDFINGGPPCQGFSGMNRFSDRAWSKIQCEMILAFLGYVDYYRPKYFLLENVRNFVSFNKGQTFRLTLATLLEMGYQVRFGILQAGNYGVSQSRKRAFIWAASPEEKLPEWPEPMHVFASSQLKVTLPGGQQYAAVVDAALGAPLRSITVRDTIGDLPPVENGAKAENIEYGNGPQSWFQKEIRGNQNLLFDHICKEMNELNHLRCKRIPKRPGADWRDLPEEQVKLSSGAVVDLIPWCLPNTAARHNQWKGLFGRLDWDGNFPTSVTDPQPMGKVGLCFHPEQDRIVTVRECARSQGFPDSYKFCGNINFKHRQIGNAVPPPLARALGNTLKKAIESNKEFS